MTSFDCKNMFSNFHLKVSSYTLTSNQKGKTLKFLIMSLGRETIIIIVLKNYSDILLSTRFCKHRNKKEKKTRKLRYYYKYLMHLIVSPNFTLTTHLWF